jgi:hypothetical protein
MKESSKSESHRNAKMHRKRKYLLSAYSAIGVFCQPAMAGREIGVKA